MLDKENTDFMLLVPYVMHLFQSFPKLIVS